MATTLRRDTVTGDAGQAAAAAIMAEFRSAIRELRCMASERRIRRGLSMTHWHVVSLLDRHGEMPMSHLAELLDVSVSNATGIVDRMEERGLVERVRVPDDRRVVIVKLSDPGRELLGEIEVVRDELLVDILGRLDARQLDRLARAVTDVRAAVLAALAEQGSALAHEHSHGNRPTAHSET